MAERRIRTSGEPQRKWRDSPRSIRDEQIPTSRSSPDERAANAELSSSSSSSSSYLDISRAFPEKLPKGISAIRTFFTAPSERHRVRRRKSTRILRLSNSSSSSVNSDLAYGTGFIKRRKGERPPHRRRDYPSNGSHRPNVASDAAILAMGAELAALAKKQNKLDLMEARNSGAVPSRRQNTGPWKQYETSRGGGISKPTPNEFDEDGWESASDAESETSSVDSRLAYGEGNGTGGWGWRRTRPRKSSVVDPRLFGRENSLHGVVHEPVGFEDVRLDFAEPFEPPTMASSMHRADSVVSSAAPSMQYVYPVPTSDPSRFDAVRSSVISAQRERFPDNSRPDPIPLQQPQPIAPVSQRVYDPPYSAPSEVESTRSKPASRSSSLAGAALAGLTATAVGAAIVADRKDERKDKERRRDDTKDRFDEERKSDHRSERRTEKCDEARGSRTEDRDDRREKRRERRREEDRDFPQSETREERRERRRKEGRSYPDEDRESNRERRREEDLTRVAEEAASRRREENLARLAEEAASRRREEDLARLAEEAASRRQKEALQQYRRDSDHIEPSYDRSTQDLVREPVDPFQYQVSDDAFQTPDARKSPESFSEYPVRPPIEIITVEREPDFVKKPSSSTKKSLATEDWTASEQRASDKLERSRRDKEAENIYQEAEHFTAPVEVGAISAAVAAVTAEDSRHKRRQSRDKKERRKAYEPSTDEERDYVQEEADRAYREAVLARKIASSREDNEDEPVARILTPPGMDDGKKKGPFDAPNADFQLDHVMDPTEFKGFSPVATRSYPSDRDFLSSRKGNAALALTRPLLTLVRPTPTPTPTPEKQELRTKDKSSYEKAGPIETASKIADAVIIGPKGTIIQSPSSSPPNTPKVVTWGENQTKHYEVESPGEHRDEFISERSPKDQGASTKPEEKPPSAKKRSGWGAIAAGIIGNGAAAAMTKDVPSLESFEYKGVVVEPEETPQESRKESPPAVGPKPALSQPSHMPGSFDDDIDFAATLAAGLQDTGFDPNIVIDDPTYRRRTSPPGSDRPTFYQQPFAETVSDLGVVSIDSPGHEGAPPLQGFVIGEVPETPQDETNERDESTTKLSKKELRKSDKAARRQASDSKDDTSSKETPLSTRFVEEPESYFDPEDTSRKDKKQSKKSKRSLAGYGNEDEDTPKVSVPVDAYDDVRDSSKQAVGGSEEWDVPKKSKKSKRDRERSDLPTSSNPFNEPLPVSSETSKDDYEEPRKSKKSSKRDSGVYDSADIPMPAVSKAAKDDYEEPKKSRKSSKRDSGAFEPADIPLPTTSEVSRKDYEESKKSRRSSKRDSGVSDPADVPLPYSTGSEVSSRADYEEPRKSKRSSKRDSGRFDSPSRPDPANVPLPSASEVSRDDREESRKSRKSSKRDSAHSDWDTHSMGSRGTSRHGDDDEDTRRSKKKEKEKDKDKDKEKKNGGFFGLFGSSTSKSESDKTKDKASKSSYDDYEERKKKSKKSKRSSTVDGSEVYGSIGAQSLTDISSQAPNGNGYDSYDDDGHESRRHSNGHKERESGGKANKTEESFLVKAGTLGAGVGLAGAAVALAAQHQQSKAAAAEHQERSLATSVPGVTGPKRSKSADSPLQSEEPDPEIIPHQFRASIDPQYGDLLPLPPSEQGSSRVQPGVDLPALPDSRPSSPKDGRIDPRQRPVVATRKIEHHTPTRVPSQSAIPLKFMMGGRSHPMSPGTGRSSPLASPATTSPNTIGLPRARSRPTSWEKTNEYQPLLLLDQSRRGSHLQPSDLKDAFSRASEFEPTQFMESSDQALEMDAQSTTPYSSSLAQLSHSRSISPAHSESRTKIAEDDFAHSRATGLDLPAGVSESTEHALSNELIQREEPSGHTQDVAEPPPVESDTKSRSSYLFQATPPPKKFKDGSITSSPEGQPIQEERAEDIADQRSISHETPEAVVAQRAAALEALSGTLLGTPETEDPKLDEVLSLTEETLPQHEVQPVSTMSLPSAVDVQEASPSEDLAFVKSAKDKGRDWEGDENLERSAIQEDSIPSARSASAIRSSAQDQLDIDNGRLPDVSILAAEAALGQERDANMKTEATFEPLEAQDAHSSSPPSNIPVKQGKKDKRKDKKKRNETSQPLIEDESAKSKPNTVLNSFEALNTQAPITDTANEPFSSLEEDVSPTTVERPILPEEPPDTISGVSAEPNEPIDDFLDVQQIVNRQTRIENDGTEQSGIRTPEAARYSDILSNDPPIIPDEVLSAHHAFNASEQPFRINIGKQDNTDSLASEESAKSADTVPEIGFHGPAERTPTLTPTQLEERDDNTETIRDFHDDDRTESLPLGIQEEDTQELGDLPALQQVEEAGKTKEDNEVLRSTTVEGPTPLDHVPTFCKSPDDLEIAASTALPLAPPQKEDELEGDIQSIDEELKLHSVEFVPSLDNTVAFARDTPQTFLSPENTEKDKSEESWTSQALIKDEPSTKLRFADTKDEIQPEPQKPGSQATEFVSLRDDSKAPAQEAADEEFTLKKSKKDRKKKKGKTLQSWEDSEAPNIPQSLAQTDSPAFETKEDQLPATGETRSTEVAKSTPKEPAEELFASKGSKKKKKGKKSGAVEEEESTSLSRPSSREADSGPSTTLLREADSGPSTEALEYLDLYKQPEVQPEKSMEEVFTLKKSRKDKKNKGKALQRSKVEEVSAIVDPVEANEVVETVPAQLPDITTVTAEDTSEWDNTLSKKEKKKLKKNRKTRDVAEPLPWEDTAKEVLQVQPDSKNDVDSQIDTQAPMPEAVAESHIAPRSEKDEVDGRNAAQASDIQAPVESALVPQVATHPDEHAKDAGERKGTEATSLELTPLSVKPAPEKPGEEQKETLIPWNDEAAPSETVLERSMDSDSQLAEQIKMANSAVAQPLDVDPVSIEVAKEDKVPETKEINWDSKEVLSSHEPEPSHDDQTLPTEPVIEPVIEPIIESLVAPTTEDRGMEQKEAHTLEPSDPSRKAPMELVVADEKEEEESQPTETFVSSEVPYEPIISSSSKKSKKKNRAAARMMTLQESSFVAPVTEPPAQPKNKANFLTTSSKKGMKKNKKLRDSQAWEHEAEDSEPAHRSLEGVEQQIEHGAGPSDSPSDMVDIANEAESNEPTAEEIIQPAVVVPESRDIPIEGPAATSATPMESAPFETARSNFSNVEYFPSATSLHSPRPLNISEKSHSWGYFPSAASLLPLAAAGAAGAAVAIGSRDFGVATNDAHLGSEHLADYGERNDKLHVDSKMLEARLPAQIDMTQSRAESVPLPETPMRSPSQSPPVNKASPSGSHLKIPTTDVTGSDLDIRGSDDGVDTHQQPEPLRDIASAEASASSTEPPVDIGRQPSPGHAQISTDNSALDNGNGATDDNLPTEYSEEQLELARQMKLEFEAGNKKSKKGKKGRQALTRSTAQDDIVVPESPTDQQALTSLETPLKPSIENIPNSQAPDGLAAGYNDEQLSLAKQLKAEFESGTKKPKKGKKSRSASQTPQGHETGASYFEETQSGNAQPLEEASRDVSTEDVSDNARAAAGGFAAGYNEDQLELARQMREEFGANSKKSKKEKKRQSLLRSVTDDNISEVTARAAAVSLPISESDNPSSSAVTDVPEEIAIVSKKSKKEKKRKGMSGSATKDDSEQKAEDIVDIKEPTVNAGVGTASESAVPEVVRPLTEEPRVPLQEPAPFESNESVVGVGHQDPAEQAPGVEVIDEAKEFPVISKKSKKDKKRQSRFAATSTEDDDSVKVPEGNGLQSDPVESATQPIAREVTTPSSEKTETFTMIKKSKKDKKRQSLSRSATSDNDRWEEPSKASVDERNVPNTDLDSAADISAEQSNDPVLGVPEEISLNTKKTKKDNKRQRLVDPVSVSDDGTFQSNSDAPASTELESATDVKDEWSQVQPPDEPEEWALPTKKGKKDKKKKGSLLRPTVQYDDSSASMTRDSSQDAVSRLPEKASTVEYSRELGISDSAAAEAESEWSYPPKSSKKGKKKKGKLIAQDAADEEADASQKDQKAAEEHLVEAKEAIQTEDIMDNTDKKIGLETTGTSQEQQGVESKDTNASTELRMPLVESATSGPVDLTAQLGQSASVSWADEVAEADASGTKEVSYTAKDFSMPDAIQEERIRDAEQELEPERPATLDRIDELVTAATAGVRLSGSGPLSSTSSETPQRESMLAPLHVKRSPVEDQTAPNVKPKKDKRRKITDRRTLREDDLFDNPALWEDAKPPRFEEPKAYHDAPDVEDSLDLPKDDTSTTEANSVHAPIEARPVVPSGSETVHLHDNIKDAMSSDEGTVFKEISHDPSEPQNPVSSAAPNDQNVVPQIVSENKRGNERQRGDGIEDRLLNPTEGERQEETGGFSMLHGAEREGGATQYHNLQNVTRDSSGTRRTEDVMPRVEGTTADDHGSQELDWPSQSALPVVPEEESLDQPSFEDMGSKGPNSKLDDNAMQDPNRDSAFVTESPVPAQQAFADDREHVRDSGVHMRDWSPAPTKRASGQVASTDEALARLSWPIVDEDKETVDLEHSQRAQPVKKHPANTGVGISTAAAATAAALATVARSQEHPASKSESTRVGRLTPEIGRLHTPDHPKFRPGSVGSIRSTASGTPPLRRSDRKFSGDLRSLSQRSSTVNLAKDAKEAEGNPATSSNVNDHNPIANEGRTRAKDMADVYDGFGEGRMGSPMSPTRPHSMRRRQSMQVLDLESRLAQLEAENRLLAEAKAQAESSLQVSQKVTNTLADREAEVDSLKQTLDWLHREVTRLKEVNDGLTSANITLGNQHNERYGMLETQHFQTQRDLQDARDAHSNLSAGMESIVRNEVANATASKDQEIIQLQRELESAREQIRSMQLQILEAKSGDSEFLMIRDVDYFDTACQNLCQHVQQWVLRFSKFSDMRACRLTSEINNDKIIDRLDNAVLDGSDVDVYLADRVKRRDIFMSMTMTMIWEFVFTRYLFGMDREQRQKLKSLEKTLSEVGPPSAVHQWRATTLTLLARRDAFQQQREQDTEAVVQMVFQTLSEILPPPSQLEEQIQEQLRKVMRAAVDLSIEMRTQRAEYMMLPPLQPEYDANGDLAHQVTFKADLMNERSGDAVSNAELQEQQAVVRVVLFPLVVKRGDDNGAGDEEVVVCPAQVLVAKAKKSVRIFSPDSAMAGQAGASRVSMQSSMPEGHEGMI
ncbi:MAG: hypothetical protein M1818_007045 [Claussenomyces sp. TS43310]|nr:MAG: hypothetical protein M1818_007045 [Claussenomyces sp. TS43310]